MKIQIATAVVVLAIFGAFSARVPTVLAATVDELRQQIDAKNDEVKKIQEELRQYNEELSKTAQVSNTLKNKVATLNKNLTSLRKQIALTEALVKQKQLEIRQYDLSIKAKESDIMERRESIKTLVRSLAETENANIVEILLQHDTLSDFFSAVEQTKNVQKELSNNLTELRVTKKDLEADRATAEKRKKQLAQFQEALSDKRQITQTEQKQQQNLLTETKGQEKRYQELVAETEKRAEEIQRDIDELENELRKRVDASSLPSRREGFLKWPAEGILSQKYGVTPFSRYSKYYTFHNGIDIAASTGTDVTVADNGRVIATGNSDAYCPKGAYGKFIVIDHGNNLMTLYGHLSLLKVSVGQSVERGQLIAYMGSTGRSTGPHLHFTVYDARTLQLRQSKLCGILPYGGSVNPLDYL